MQVRRRAGSDGGLGLIRGEARTVGRVPKCTLRISLVAQASAVAVRLSHVPRKGTRDYLVKKRPT